MADLIFFLFLCGLCYYIEKPYEDSLINCKISCFNHHNLNNQVHILRYFKNFWPCSYIFEIQHKMLGHHLLFKQSVKLPTSHRYNRYIICMYTDAKCILQSCPVSPLDSLDIKKLHLEYLSLAFQSSSLKIIRLAFWNPITFNIVIKSIMRQKNIASKISR